ncbi:CTD small phosphatase-like protein 2 [Linum grandiflorum]
MPSLKMKTKLSRGYSGEKGLGVCQASSVICKKSCSNVMVSPLLEADLSIQKSSKIELLDQQQLSNQRKSHFQTHDSKVDSGTVANRDSTHNCTDDLETIFSPALDPIGICNMPNLDENPGIKSNLIGPDGWDLSTQLSDYRTCKISDFSISNMITSCLPFDGNAMDLEIESFPGYRWVEPSMFFDHVAQECLLLPFLEDITKSTDSNDTKSGVESTGDDSAFTQLSTNNQDSDPISDSDQVDNFDPQLFIRNLPELSEVVSNFQPSTTFTKDSQRRKSVTLVLDLDETLVHSTLERCEDADFTFTVAFNTREHTVYVKKRPHLHTFLERVAEMFDLFVFTASQSIYAEKLLDILDAEDKKLISRRLFRESCIFSDGTYTKDLTVLGLDLAKVAIIDNTPQVFSLQINNGIPIKSWFSDPSDCALLSLLPFLETLADVDDVRPIIARRFAFACSFSFPGRSFKVIASSSSKSLSSHHVDDVL